MQAAVKAKNSNSIATLLGQGFRLLLEVDPNVVFLSSLHKNYTNMY